jgi:predicted  nucleic acid-binding Zn-ribbon protein
VTQIDALLGDTSAAPPTVTVSGTGCDSKVSAPVAGGTVYSSLLQVTAQLNAYSRTTLACRDELQQAIATTIGPADTSSCPPNADNATSVTCSLAATRNGFAAVTASIADAQKVTDGLDPEKDFASSQATVDDLIKQLTALVDATSTDPAKSETAKQLAAAKAAIGNARDSLKQVSSAIDDINTSALANKDDADSMVTQNQAAADAICPVIGDGTQPGTLSAETAEKIRSFLVTRSCPDVNGDTTALTPPAPYTAAMSTRLQKQSDQWADLAKQTDPKNTDNGIAKSLTATTDALTDADTAIDAASASVADLNTAAGKSLDTLQTLSSGLGDLEKTYSDATAALDKSLADAAKNASTANLDKAIKEVSDQGAASSAQLGTAFENSAAGLTSAAQALEDNGKKAIAQQRTVLVQTEKDASTSLSAATSNSLDQISGSVTSASRDLGSTRTQLTADLGNILLDLGNPNVSGSGVIGTVKKGADAAGSADYQLALASDQTSSYASVRGQDVAGIMLRQAQAEAALAQQAKLPAFELQLPNGVQHRSVYSFHLSAG